MRQTLASLHTFWTLPDNASFDDYLSAVRRLLTDPKTGAGLAPQLFLDVLDNVEQLSEQVKQALNEVEGLSTLAASCPSAGGLD